MTPRAVESRPDRATGTPLDPATLWSAETEARARAARRAERRARKQAERYRAKSLRLAQDIANAERREARLRAREADLLAELTAAAAEIARLAGLVPLDTDEALGAARLAAATEEMHTLRPKGRHPRKDQT